MKKIIMVAGVMVTFCLNLSAQKCNPSAAVTESFSREFKEASNITWTQIKGNTRLFFDQPVSVVYLSRFDNEGEHCLAYFGSQGDLILSGRKIELAITPKAVQNATEKIRSKSEAKGDLLSVTEVYELSDSAGTRYFINLNSQSVTMSILAYGNGTSEILKSSSGKGVSITGSVLAAGK